MIQHPRQLAPVPFDHRIEPTAGLVGIFLTGRNVFEQFGAQHRHERQRHHCRDENGNGERYREFAEQPPDDVLHEQQRDQHRNQRNGQGDDGETDLACALERGVQRTFSLLDVARYVLDHHDGVVHDETGRDRQCHQRQVVQAVARCVHDREGADKRQRHGEAGDDGCRDIAQEEIDHQHDQNDG